MYKIGIECESIEGQSWGVGRVVTKLLEEISKRPELQKEFKFFLYFKSKIPDLPYLADPLFVKRVIKLPLIRPSFSLYYYLLLPIRLYFEGLDLIYFPNYMLPIIFKGKSLVTLTEDVYYEFKQGTLPFRYKLAYKIFANWAAKHATKIMAISETSKKEITELFKIHPERIVVNQLGVERPQTTNPKFQALNPKQIQNRLLRRSGFGCEGRAKFQPITSNLKPNTYILYVGQAFPRRHLRETMLAFQELAPGFPNLKLVAIGSDKYNPPIIEKLKDDINHRLGRDAIIYKEYVPEDELHQLYTGTELVIYISSKEAFGLPPLEALACGSIPLVAKSDVAKEIFGQPSLACRSGRTKAAFFVENPDDPHSIARAIAEGLTNSKKRAEIKNLASRILGKYTWSAHTDRFIETIKAIAKKRF